MQKRNEKLQMTQFFVYPKKHMTKCFFYYTENMR